MYMSGGGGDDEGGSVTQVLRQASDASHDRAREARPAAIVVDSRSDGAKTGFESVSWTWER